MTELAFLRAGLALEAFLHESFILYSLGRLPPKGRPPHRYALPPNREHLAEWVREGRDHASWDVSGVPGLARRFFKDGGPFLEPLRNNQQALQDAKTIRNAIAHGSEESQERFVNLVRRHLGTAPPNTTPGSFLVTTVPASAPPESFLDFYIAKFELVATLIVPPS
jgi:hypothetical protein